MNINTIVTGKVWNQIPVSARRPVLRTFKKSALVGLTAQELALLVVNNTSQDTFFEFCFQLVACIEGHYIQDWSSALEIA